MKLLFQNTTVSTEVKKHLGFLDANTKIKNIMPDIKTATNDVIDIIGRDVYDYATTAYAATPTDEESFEYQLIEAIQYPIIVNAYRLYAPSNDLSHTNDGRKMRNEEHEKNAFEWMIDRDNQSHEKRYYRALDDLIHFLDNTTDSNFGTTWKNSSSFIQTQKLFVRTTKDFDEYFVIQSRYLLTKLSPGMQTCENREILPRIGQAKFDELKTKLKANTPITDAKDLKLIDLIKEACVCYSLAWAIPRLSINIFPEGVVQSYMSDRNSTRAILPALKLETAHAQQEFLKSFNKVAIDIENLVKPTPIITDTNVQPTIITGTNFISA